MKLSHLSFLFVLFVGISSDSSASSLSCNLCISAGNLIKTILTSDLIMNKIVMNLIYYGCLRSHSKSYCDDSLSTVQRFHYVAELSLFNVVEVCTKLSLCSQWRIVEDKDEDYARKVLKDTPPVIRAKARYTSEPIRFAVFADIHLDYGYQENRNANCKGHLCCRADSDWANGTKNAAGMYGMLAVCDLPQATVDSFIDFALKEVAPDFFVWLGDNPAHNTYQQVKETHLDGLKHISKRLSKEFSHEVYGIHGNHEGLPCDQFQPVENGSHQWVWDQSEESWRKWLNEESRKSLKRRGCYSQLYRNTKMRILAITPFMMINSNRWLWGNQTDPMGILSYVESELSKAEKHHERVLIITHVPQNHPPSNPYYSQRYAYLLQRYSNIIISQLFGHVHLGYFILNQNSVHTGITSVGLVNPSLTTKSELLPSFRVYELDPENLVLRDYVEYRMDLLKSNKDRKGYWGISHRFTKYYEVPDMSVKSFESIFNRMKTDNEFWKKVLIMRYQEGPKGIRVFNNEAHWEKERCEYHSTTIMDSARCMKLSNSKTTQCYNYGYDAWFFCRKWERLIMEKENK